MKYGFVIILIKIAGYNYPEALGTAKGQEKQRVSDGLPLAVEIFLTARQGLRLPSSFPPLTCVGNLLLHFISSQRALHLALRFLPLHVPPRFCCFFVSVVNVDDLHTSRAQRLISSVLMQGGGERWRLLGRSRGLHLRPEAGTSPIFTFAVFAVSFVARLADAFVGLDGVLADGVDAAVVEPLCTLVHIYTE